MRKYFYLYSFLLLLPIGCNNDSSPKEEDSETSYAIQKRGPTQLKYMNNHRSEFQFTDGFTVRIVPSTRLEVQRPSCSGFETGDSFKLSEVEKVEYSYDLTDPSFNPVAKVANAVAIRIYRKGCGSPDLQYVNYLDTDKDFYADVVDEFPTDPTKH